jgi:hypothetical protein
MLRVLVVGSALLAGAFLWTAPSAPGGPRYTPDGELLLPAGVERWVAVGSSLGLGYSEVEQRSGAALFHTVFLEPGAYDDYRRTGRFPDGTMLALVLRAPSAGTPPSRAGRFAGDLAAIEMAVKDTARYPGGWAYFDFGRGGPGSAARPFPSQRCAACHARHAARDNVFIQFYPLLSGR